MVQLSRPSTCHGHGRRLSLFPCRETIGIDPSTVKLDGEAFKKGEILRAVRLRRWILAVIIVNAIRVQASAE